MTTRVINIIKSPGNKNQFVDYFILDFNDETYIKKLSNIEYGKLIDIVDIVIDSLNSDKTKKEINDNREENIQRVLNLFASKEKEDLFDDFFITMSLEDKESTLNAVDVQVIIDEHLSDDIYKCPNCFEKVIIKLGGDDIFGECLSCDIKFLEEDLIKGQMAEDDIFFTTTVVDDE